MARLVFSFFPAHILRQQPRVLLGFAAYLSWVDLLLCFEGILRDEVNEAGGLIHDPVFMGATLGAAVTLFAAGLLDAPTTQSKRRSFFTAPSQAEKAALVLAGVLGCVLTLVGALLASLAPDVSRGVLYPLGAGLGACLAIFTLSWGRELANFDLRATLLTVSAATCAQWVAFAPFALTGLAGHLAAAALPLGSAAALALRKPARCGCEQKRSAVTYVRGACEGVEASSCTGTAKPQHVLVRLSAGAALIAFAIQLVWSFSIKMLPGHLDTGLFCGLFVLAAVALAAVGMLCVLAMERQRSYRLELYYRIACGLCLLGAAAVGLAAVGSTQATIFSTYALTYIGHALIWLTVWLLVLGCVSMGALPLRKAVGVVFGANYLGMFAGFACVEALAATFGSVEAHPSLAPAVVFAAVGAVTLVYLAVFPERTLLALSPQLFGLSPIGVEERCEQVAAQAGLTPREAQVLALLARGRDVTYICEELGIARNTVNVHRKGVYSKLGIHSQQELLDYVEHAGRE